MELLQPLTVKHIALAARQIFDMAGIDQDDFESARLQDLVRCYPVTAGALQGNCGDAALFDQLLQKAKSAKTPEEYKRYLYALTSFRDPALIKRALELGISGQIRNQDSPYFLSAIMQDEAGMKIAWDFVRNHWNRVIGQTTTSSGVAIIAGTQNFCDQQGAQQVRQFFTVNKVTAAERTLKQTLEKISGCTDFKFLQQSNLSSWISSRTPTKAGGN